ncbi:MAG: ABC transporter permease [SAR86 cluster bacterium]|nr:ABC transporter permease [SAR86 cluster bacterium]MBL6810787.1 ABC transporter permease [SAR86 cluster bacterium]
MTTLGIAIGTAVLIVVISVMNGFQNELKERILGVIPHVTIEQEGGFDDIEKVINQVESLPNVINATEHLSTQIVVNSDEFSRGVFLKGTDSISELSIIPNNMIIGNLKDLDDQTNIVIGDGLANELRVGPGDAIQLLNINQTNPLLGLPRIVTYTVSGIFSVGSEVDSNYALIGLESFKMLVQPNNGTAIEAKLDDVLLARETGRTILNSIDTDRFLKVSTWEQQYGGLFRAVQLERIMMSMLMSLILLVAIFSLLMSINNLIKNNEKEIAILRTIGYSEFNIQRIFIQLIFTIGFFGIVLGNIIGYLMASNITEMLNFLSEAFNISILSVYYLDYFPSIFSFDQVLIINIITLFLLILFGMLPARKAAKMNPVEIINNP